MPTQKRSLASIDHTYVWYVINFSYSTSLPGGIYLLNTDSYFLHQMNEYLFFKGEIHITLSKDQGNRFPEDKREEIVFAFLLASDCNLVLKFFSFCALLSGDHFTEGKLGRFFSILQYLSILDSLLHLKKLVIGKKDEGKLSSLHSCELKA